MQLFDTVALWLGRVEATLSGADIDLREGREALRAGESMRARTCAHRALERVPGSPLGLALLADACEAQGLHAELLVTLEELARRIPSRPDVWLRVGLARALDPGAIEEAREAMGRALALSRPDNPIRPATLTALAELDLNAGDALRAELWLDRLIPPFSDRANLLRARARLELGDPARAAALLEKAPEDATSAELAYTHGQALALLRKPEAFALLIRAYVLDHPLASRALSAAIGWMQPDPEVLERVRAVVGAHEELDSPRFRAAFARARGDIPAAVAALSDAVRAGDQDAAVALFDAALAEHDGAALSMALERLPPTLGRAAEQARALVTHTEAPMGPRLDALASLDGTTVISFRRAEVDRVLARSIPPEPALSTWNEILERMTHLARELGLVSELTEVAALAEARVRPIRMAIVGEFNAGKSTFINALIGEDVAPTGVLPTTATLHHLRYAQDRIARIHLDPPIEGTTERIVAFPDLKRAIKESGDNVSSVELLAPLPSLTRAEVIDTPGFNAPDARHAAAAKTSFAQADIVLWILDAAQALKATEGAILRELEREGIPIQVFVNKSDRLTFEEQATVLASIEAGLAALGVVSRSPIRFVSARLALAARTGEPEKLEASGWPAIDAWFEQEIVAKSEELKERSLRRRAREIALRIGKEARARGERLAAAAEEEAATNESMRLRAFELEGESERYEQEIAGALTPVLERYRADVAAVSSGSRSGDSDPLRADGSLQRYASDRATLLLAEPILGVISRVAQFKLFSEDQKPNPMARALARTAAIDSTPVIVGRIVLGAIIDTLLTLASREAPAEHARAAGLADELEQWAASLAHIAKKAPVNDVV